MSGRHQPENGADSAQALANAIALAEAGYGIVPACIACELPALPNDIYCKGHARLMDYTSGEKWAANE